MSGRFRRGTRLCECATHVLATKAPAVEMLLMPGGPLTMPMVLLRRYLVKLPATKAPQLIVIDWHNVTGVQTKMTPPPPPLFICFPRQRFSTAESCHLAA